MTSSTLALIYALQIIHPEIEPVNLKDWVKHLTVEAKAKSIEPSLIAAIIERASQWRPRLVNCNGDWLGAKTSKALTVEKIVSAKIKCTKSMDFGFGQLNYPITPSYSKMLEITEPKTNISLLANYLSIKKSRCVKPIKLFKICKTRGWLALLNIHSKPAVEKAILNIESKIKIKMREYK